MRSSIVLVVLLVASACSGSVVVGEQEGAVADSVAATTPPASEAELDPAPTPDPNATPEVFTDDLGDWYVPAAGTLGSEPDRVINTSRSAAETVAEINASVPADYNLSFAWQSMVFNDDGDTAEALAPVEWTRDPGEYDYEYEDITLDFFTEYEVDTGCQGFCAPQRWEELMNDPAGSPLRIRRDQQIEIMINQTLTNPPGRLLVVDRSAVDTGGTSISVEVVRWSNSADRFFECNARLGEPDRSLWPTFADVCLVAVGDWLE